MAIRMKELAQLVPPAMLGRRQRIQSFREYVEANRKDLSASKIVARFSVESGIAYRTVEGYLKLFYEAGVYVKPTFKSKWLIVTPEEYTEILCSAS